MRRLVVCLLTLFSAASQLGAQPAIAEQGVTNAASYSILGTPNGGGLAAGSIMVIFGSGLGPPVVASATGYPLPVELAGTQVRIGSASAYLVYSSATQVAAIVPSSVQPGTHDVTVTFRGQTSAPVRVPIVFVDFGIFTRNAAGYGQAAAQTVLVPNGEVRTLGLATSVRSGEPVVLYGTGLAATPGVPDDRPPGVARTIVPVQILIAGKEVSPEYAGRSPNYPGLDQINFIVPSDLEPGCYVPVAVRAGGRLSNVASLPVAGLGRTCPHAFAISEQAASRVDAGGFATIAQVLGERQSSAGGPIAEGIGIGFAEVDANALEISADESEDPYGTPALGTCALEVVDGNRTIIRRPTVSRARFLDAGQTVRLQGPGYTTDLLRTPGSTYGTNLPPGTLRPGNWTFSSGGGSDVGVFQLSADIPEPLTWTNRQEVIDPRQPLRIEWTGGGNSVMYVWLSAGSETPSGRNFASIKCAATDTQTLTIPANLLGMLPAGASGGILFRRSVVRTGFGVPLVRGGAVDGALYRVIHQTYGTIRLQN